MARLCAEETVHRGTPRDFPGSIKIERWRRSTYVLRFMASRKNSHDPRSFFPSVVKVFTVSDAPNYEQPWQTDGPASSSGSGAIIRTRQGPRVLTNAHVVENQVFVEVRRYGESHKYVARVEGVSHDCDLALLSVAEESFFADAKPLPLGKLPALTDRVSVLGYPIGGDGISITDGIVSRIEMFRYAQSQRLLLAVQVDAAINSGNSGGPVIKNGEIVGVAFQSLEEGEGINYMIAAPVVRHFIRDVESGVVGGFPHLGIRLQPLESTAHRQALRLSKPHGALVCQVAYDSSAWGKLKPDDVLLEIAGTRVGPRRDGHPPKGRKSRLSLYGQ